MGYTLYIRKNTFLDKDKVKDIYQGQSTISDHITITETVYALKGWEVAQSIVPTFCDEQNGEIDKEDLVEMLQAYADMNAIDHKHFNLDSVLNTKYGFNHGDVYFTYSQDY